jgi:hypothetical protein
VEFRARDAATQDAFVATGFGEQPGNPA